MVEGEENVEREEKRAQDRAFSLRALRDEWRRRNQPETAEHPEVWQEEWEGLISETHFPTLQWFPLHGE